MEKNEIELINHIVELLNLNKKAQDKIVQMMDNLHKRLTIIEEKLKC